MTYTIVISKEAENDLRAIYEYIAFELLAPDAAAGQLGRLEKAMLSLEEMPHRFRKYDKQKWEKRNMHIMPVDNYCVFYIPDDNAQVS